MQSSKNTKRGAEKRRPIYFAEDCKCSCFVRLGRILYLKSNSYLKLPFPYKFQFRNFLTINNRFKISYCRNQKSFSYPQSWFHRQLKLNVSYFHSLKEFYNKLFSTKKMRNCFLKTIWSETLESCTKVQTEHLPKTLSLDAGSRSIYFDAEFSDSKSKPTFSSFSNNVPFNPLSASPTKWLNTLKQFVGKSLRIVWVLGHFGVRRLTD